MRLSPSRQVQLLAAKHSLWADDDSAGLLFSLRAWQTLAVTFIVAHPSNGGEAGFALPGHAGQLALTNYGTSFWRRMLRLRGLLKLLNPRTAVVGSKKLRPNSTRRR